MQSLLIIPLSIATVAYAQDSSVRGIVSNHEAVSSEPLTFEFTEPEQPDRNDERILLAAEEANIANGRDEFDWMADYEVMDGLDLLDGEEELWDVADEDEFIYDDMEEDVYGDVEEFDSSYDSEDGTEFFPTQMEGEDEEEFIDEEEEFEYDEEGEEEGEGYDEIGAPMEFNEPIARRLRRVTPNAEQEEKDLERDLAEKESLRDTTSPIVSYFSSMNLIGPMLHILCTKLSNILLNILSICSSCPLKMKMRNLNSSSSPNISRNSLPWNSIRMTSTVTSTMAAIETKNASRLKLSPTAPVSKQAGTSAESTAG